MKILKLEAENVKRLKAVSIAPDPKDPLVLVEGRNAQGKTSVLDAIAWAIGGKRLIQGKPIRDGEEEAEVRIDLGDLQVLRRWTADGSTLRVSSKDKGRLKSPQYVLDALLGEISFDPLAFSRMKPSERVETLLSVCEVDIDLGRYAMEREDVYQERRDVNRTVRERKATLDAFTVNKPKLKLNPINTEVLVDELDEASKAKENAEILQRDIDIIVEQIENLEAQLMTSREDLERAKKHRFAAETEVGRLREVSEIKSDISSAGEKNEEINAEKARRDLARSLACAEDDSKNLTEQLDEMEAEKNLALKNAKMPVDGLSFDVEDVLFNGVPFDQASSAEQLRISLGIAMEANPDLRVLRITDGSLLDEDNLSMIRTMAEAEDYQVWIERVGESGDVAVVIEDGEVKRNPALDIEF